MTTTQSQTEKVFELLEQFSTAMMITHADGDQLRARPMAVAKLEPSGRMWFITGDRSAKINELKADTRVELIFQKENSIYLSVGGRASLVREPAKVRELWKESYRVWFPGGKDDPDIMLIEVTPERAEYWDHHGLKKLEYLFDAVKAYVSGEKMQVKEGEHHGVVTM